MRRFAQVSRLLGDGDNTEANPGTFENVEVTAATLTSAHLAPGTGQVCISIKAACVNYPDLLQTVGGYQHKPTLPFIPGGEAAGVVSRVGPGVDGIAVGDRVACSGAGMISSVVLARADSCWVLPRHYSFAEGASFGTGYRCVPHPLTHIVRRAI